MKKIYSLLLLSFVFQIIASAYDTAVDSQESKIEICDNRIDDDGDGLIDCMDPDCSEYDNNCWQCTTEFYQVHSNTYLVALDPIYGTYTTIATISGASQINGAQFNPVDGHVYAPCVIDGQHTLGMVAKDGSVTDLGLSLPGSSLFYYGAIDASGRMFVGNSRGVHMIDLQSPTLTYIDTGVPHLGIADLSLDITRNLFYGITGGKKLKVFNPTTNEVKEYSLSGSINSDSGAFGAVWSCNDGSFFAYNNSSGKVYSVDVNNLTATEVINATGNLSTNDGFNCVSAAPPFESNCGDGRDEDGDGLIDCDDSDCFSSNMCTLEICNNGIDDDGDGWIDCSDTECYSMEGCLEICDNKIDDNGDGFTDGNDPQCGTTSGVTGGLESNRRLSEKISKRNYNLKVKNPKAYNEKLEGLIPFTSSDLKKSFGIQSFIPSEMEEVYVSESTPSDLVDITNASEVIAADYYKNHSRVASVLGIYTEQGVYEHTKYICDRLDGSRLLDISYLYAKGGNFISYELLTKNGQREYAVSLAASHSATEGFAIENHWNLHKYAEDKDYYNYQIWANSYEQLIDLLENLLDKMAVVDKIDRIEHSAIPRVFVMQGDYINGALQLVVKNKNRTPNLRFQGNLTRSEKGAEESIDIHIPLSGIKEEVVTVQTGYLYDLGASITAPGSPDDEIFLADGAWGVDDQNPNATVTSFEVTREGMQSEGEMYQVERSIEVEANVKDYLNIYRSLDAKLNAQNLSAYNSLAFTAQGTGVLEITLVRESIAEWESQYRTQIQLEDTSREIILFDDEFLSADGSEMSFEDVTMLVFTLIGDNNAFINKTLSLQDVRFQNSFVSSLQELQNDLALSITPNPTENMATLQFDSEYRSTVSILLTDFLGRQIQQDIMQVEAGTNSVNVDLSFIEVGTYIITIKDKSGNVSTSKITKIK